MWAVLLVAGALLPLLAGCNGPPRHEPVLVTSDVAGDQLVNGTFYAFDHGGGDLEFAVAGNGSADVVLYSADDERVGHIAVGAERARGRFVLDGLGAGELVLHALSVNGTLTVRSDGGLVRGFRPLPQHVERHILVDYPVDPTGYFVLPQSGYTVDETLDVRLVRAPAQIVVLDRAQYGSLSIEVGGRSGLIFEASAGNTAVGGSTGAFFQELSGETHLENIRDGRLSVTVQATEFQGVLVLEARSFSRAARVDGGVQETADVPRFTYGVLPDQPVSFEVRTGAEMLYLWQEGDGSCEPADDETTTDDPGEEDEPACEGDEAVVALFGPDDRRVATVSVPPNGTLALPIDEGGSWVAVLLDGEATLGADRVPGDFELHPIDVVEAASPAQSAGGSDATYGQGRSVLEVAGIPFRIAATPMMDSAAGDIVSGPSFGLPLFQQCEAPAVSVLRDGETIAAWGYSLGRFTSETTGPSSLQASMFLGDGLLEVESADFGRNCERLGVLVEGYQR